jgi:hypothetical protein
MVLGNVSYQCNTTLHLDRNRICTLMKSLVFVEVAIFYEEEERVRELGRKDKRKEGRKEAVRRGD